MVPGAGRCASERSLRRLERANCNDRLDERSLAQHRPVGERKKLLAQFLAQFGDEPQSLVLG